MEYGPIRAVKDDTILSPYLPRLGVRVNEDYIYLGDLQYIAQGTCHVEEFIYICPSSLGHVTRMLLVQFEGFLENKKGKYNDPAGEPITLSGDLYKHVVSTINLPAFYKKSSGIHLAHAADYVRQRSYTLVGDMIYHTFSRIVSEDHRDRFSVYYLERCDENQLTLDTATKNTDQYASLLAQALENFSITR